MSPRIASTTLSNVSWCHLKKKKRTRWYFSQTSFFFFFRNSCWFLCETLAHHHQSLLEGGSTQCDGTHHSVRGRGYNHWSSMPEPSLLKNPCSGGCTSLSFPRGPFSRSQALDETQLWLIWFSVQIAGKLRSWIGFIVILTVLWCHWLLAFLIR